MSEVKHTPGPWWVQGNGITVCPPKPRGQSIICIAAPVHMDRKEREANARLIAAAPELLEALKLARSHAILWQGEPNEFSCEIHKATITEIDAAIAKATGA